MSSIKYHPEIEKLEHDDASAPETKRVLAYGWDTSGLQKVKLNVDADGKLNVNSTASLAGTTLPISGATEGVGVAILDGSGNQITSFGGGTQYTEGDTDATLTGTISMAEGPSNTVTPLQVDASKHLQVDIAAASTDITVQDGGGSVTVDNNGTFAVQASLNAGTNAIGKLSANSGVDIGDVDVTSISAGTNLVGDVGIQPRTTNGLDTFMASGSDGSSILVATAQAVKASAGKVYGYYLYNPEAAVTFVHFYNTASGSVTVGTTSPLFSLQIPAGSAANLMSEIGITFGTAITIAATTTAGGNTAPSTGVSATIWFK